MNSILSTIKASRNKLLSFVEELTTDGMNQIPTGFNNNLAWQIGHLVVTQQILCYKLSGQKFVIEEELIDKYKNGSKPEKYITAEEIDQLKAYLLSTLTTLETDLNAGIFTNFTPYTISTYPGLTLNNINDALTFMVSHDGLHYGCCLGLKRLIKML